MPGFRGHRCSRQVREPRALSRSYPPLHVRSLNETRVSDEIASSELVKCCVVVVVVVVAVAAAVCVETTRASVQPAVCMFVLPEREISFGKVKMAESSTIVSHARARDIAGTVCINSACNQNVTQVREINDLIPFCHVHRLYTAKISIPIKADPIFRKIEKFNSYRAASSFSFSLFLISTFRNIGSKPHWSRRALVPVKIRKDGFYHRLSRFLCQK